ncbi:DUF58 domain-containing protein [Gordonia sp. X0973]|uniref:DUF58 domain-containing protein n=1 Tax=Gordonia sp. X0973 TaxID=2742602 RepID=UPI000F5351AD|nr:DUF58 domain-containing protein [Gordonia sp. X0973]QKT08876.1 DUF58 domain-containing protein [Gordonia sp. X0973]
MFVTGRFALLVALGVIPVLIWPSGWTVLAWVAFAFALMLLDMLIAGPTTALQVTRAKTAPIRLGEHTTTTLSVVNTSGRRFVGRLRDGWQPSAGAGEPADPTRREARDPGFYADLANRWAEFRRELSGDPHQPGPESNRQDLVVAPGERQFFSVGLRPTRRGDRLAIRLTLRRYGPLRLSGRQRSLFLPGSVRALPAFDSRKHLPSRLAALRQLDGRSAVRTRGQGTEFDSLRDYVEGDDVRSIDWRATARRRSTVVRTWQPERDRHVVLLLDTSRTSAGRIGDQPRLDAAMDAALLLAALASHAGDRVDFIAGDRVIHKKVRATRRVNLLNEMVTAMAPLESALLEADWGLLGAEVARTVGQRALVVLLTPLEPAAIAESLLPTLAYLSQRYQVVIASVSDPELDDMLAERSDVPSAYRAAATARTLTQREETAAVLARLGVGVIDRGPEDLPPALADHYLSLKSRGLL